jgi:hypothetical protein
LESNFNKPGSGIGDVGSGTAIANSDADRIADPESRIPASSDRPASAAVVRFHSCRWMQPAENGNAEFCTHREVKPYAGTAGFDAEAWCPECQYYKLRRTPKKRKPEDNYTY